MVKILFFALLASLLNPGDRNDIYINKQVTHLNDLIKHGKFEKGYILFKGDTIQTEVFRFSRGKNLNPYLFCITKDKTDSIKVYTARQIEGYTIGQDIYKRQSSGDSFFFIHLCRFGKAILFERYEVPSDGRFLYYIKLPKYKNSFVICPYEQNITTTLIGGYSNGNSHTPQVDLYNSKNISERFKLFITTFLSDCEPLCNMVQSDYYTINDIPKIIDKYNSCDNN